MGGDPRRTVASGHRAPRAALFYDATLGLVGWRVIRRYGSRGLLIFLILFGLFGVMRDTLYSITTKIIVFGHGIMPLMADFFAYLSAAAIVQLVMVWIAGEPRAERLARKAKKE